MVSLKNNKAVLILSVLSSIPFIPIEFIPEMNDDLFSLFILKQISPFVFLAVVWVLISSILLPVKLFQLVKFLKEGNKLLIQEAYMTILILTPFLVFVGVSVLMYWT